jgi:hypothetical protein
MAENKKSFLLYCDLIHTISKMPNDKAGELFKHILSYVNDENPESEDLIINLTFEPIKQSLKRDLIKYEQKRIKNTENANKRWNKENANASERINNNAKNAVIDSVNDNDKVINIEERKQKFANSLSPYLSIYGKDMLNDFYGYWTQHGEKDKKFLAEKQKSFGIERRLETWKRNESKFGNKAKNDRL